MNRQEKLEWLARNRHEWTKDYPFLGVRVDHNGIIYSWPSDRLNESTFTSKEWLSMREKLQNKPSWDCIPLWAEFMAQLPNGQWEAYSSMPEHGISWMLNVSDGKSQVSSTIGSGIVLGDWRDTLEKRPELSSKNNDVRNHEDVPPSKPQDNSWYDRGELPPVGCECEVFVSDESKWMNFEVIAIRDGYVLGWCHEGLCGFQSSEKSEFRPLRTDREKAIDAAMNEIKVEDGFIYSSRSIIEKLYDAGMLK